MSVKSVIGNIPEHVTYFYSKKKKLESFWDNSAFHAGWVGQEVTPAFCSDTTNTKTMETGRTWAENQNRGYNPNNIPSVPTQEISRPNDPISGIKIVSLEHRGEGGRAYKVVTTDNFYFDVREDVLMDTMIESGISAGGFLNGTYVWARVNSEMKLVRTGSKLHDALLVSTADRALSKIGYGNFKEGHIYSSKGKDQVIFLGYVDCVTCKYEKPGNSYNYNNRSYNNPPPIMERTDVYNGLLFTDYHEPSFKMNGFKDVTPTVKTSHSYIKDIGEVVVPANILDIIREHANKKHLEYAVDRSKYGGNTQGYKEEQELSTFAWLAPRLTVRGCGEPMPKLDPALELLLSLFPLVDTVKKKVK